MEVHQSAYHQSSSAIEIEAEQIKKAKRDPRQFEPIYKKYHAQILRFVYQRLDDKELSTDVTQKIFLKVLQKLNHYEFRGLPFSSWLYRIAINELNQLFRENKKLRTIAFNDSIVTDLMDEVEDNDLELKKECLGECMKALSKDEFELIEMRFFEKRPFKEIGELLGITENNSKVKTYRVIQKLKELLENKLK